MSREKMDKIVGAAFENMDADAMKKIQGAGDVDGETLSIIVRSSANCAKSAASVLSALGGWLFSKD